MGCRAPCPPPSPIRPPCLTNFLDDLAPIFKAYTRQLLHTDQISRSAILEKMKRYPLSSAHSPQTFYQHLIQPLFHLRQVKDEISRTKIFLMGVPTLHQEIYMTIPLEDRIIIIFCPRTFHSHTNALQKSLSLAHELGHAIQTANIMANHHYVYQIDSNYPEIRAILLENLYTSPALLQKHNISLDVAHQIAFYTHYRLLIRCIKEAGRALTVVNSFRLPRFTLAAFTRITHEYARIMTRVLGYPVILPPILNSYSLFYDLECVLGHWISGINMINENQDFIPPIPITLNYHPFLQKKWKFLDESSADYHEKT